MTRTDDPAQADVLLVNTCSVREKAQEKVFSLLGEWRAIKELRPHVVIGVGGCVASQEGEGITARAPYVDLVFGPQTLHRIPDLIEGLKQTGRPQIDVSFPEIEKFDRLPLARASGATAFVSIMEGCSKYCTFCVVPYTRGEEISRPFEQVLGEVETLAAQGVREVTLLGQNVNAYAGAMGDGSVADLATLIHFVAAIPGVIAHCPMATSPVAHRIGFNPPACTRTSARSSSSSTPINSASTSLSVASQQVSLPFLSSLALVSTRPLVSTTVPSATVAPFTLNFTME